MSTKNIYRPQIKTDYSTYLYILPAFIFYIVFVFFPLRAHLRSIPMGSSAKMALRVRCWTICRCRPPEIVKKCRWSPRPSVDAATRTWVSPTSSKTAVTAPASIPPRLGERRGVFRPSKVSWPSSSVGTSGCRRSMRQWVI